MPLASGTRVAVGVRISRDELGDGGGGGGGDGSVATRTTVRNFKECTTHRESAKSDWRRNSPG